MNRLVIVVVVAAIGMTELASASPLMVVTCSAAKGVNLAAATESDKPKDSVAEVFDPAAGADVSHPKNTHGSIITVNRDGTATETSFLGDGNSIVSNMRIVGRINDNAISFTEGADGAVNLVTLYPNESLVVVAATGYLGWRRPIPTGSVYIAHCEFSKVLQ